MPLTFNESTGRFGLLHWLGNDGTLCVGEEVCHVCSTIDARYCGVRLGVRWLE